MQNIFLFLIEQQLCELYGYWCSGETAESEPLRRFRRGYNPDHEVGNCIQSGMRCDGLPDCWLDDPENSPDEVNCNNIRRPNIDEGLGPNDNYNDSSPTASCK